MTLPAIVQTYLPPLSVAHDFLSNGLEKVHMMEPHIGRLFDTLVILLIGPFEEGLGDRGALCKDRGHDRVAEWEQNDQDRNSHEDGRPLRSKYSIAGHVPS